MIIVLGNHIYVYEFCLCGFDQFKEHFCVILHEQLLRLHWFYRWLLGG
jgi:hypothetical protein